MKRLLIAAAIVAGIYGAALGTGSILYATDRIGTGATHNDCDDFRKIIADEQGIDEEDVEQRDIKALAIECLESHELTAREAFRTEFLFWAAWPAVICAAVFLAWPMWARVLRNQEEADEWLAKGGPSHEADTT